MRFPHRTAPRLPNSSAVAKTVDFRPLRGLTLPPLAVSPVPEENKILKPSSLQFLAALISLSMYCPSA